MVLWQGLLLYVLWIAFCAQSARLVIMLVGGKRHLPD
jgi:hypothetical protein